MKTTILATLLFAAVASTFLDATLADDDTGMCPREYFKKHPKLYKEKEALKQKYGLPNFNKLASCSAGGTCEGNLKCCKTPCGLKCMKPLYENNAMETMEETLKSIGQGPLKEPYEMTEEDKKYGMCPETFLQTHPEVKADMKNQCKHKKSNPNEECTHEDCQRQKGKHHRQFRNLTKLADCSVDGDCADNRRCCNTFCGKKCVKPVFTKEDFMNSVFEKEEKPREKRELGSESEEEEGECMGHGKGGKCQGKQGENGKCQGKGGGRGKGKGKGKGGERGKGKGKGGKGKGKGKGRQQDNGDENGWAQDNGQGSGGPFEGGFQ